MTIPPSTVGTSSRDRGAVPFTRRTLLTAAGAAAIAVPLGTAGLASAANNDWDWSTLIDEKPLHHTTLMQAFAFDDVRKRIYVLQLRNSAAGDLYVNELDYAGNQLSVMMLNGFGHGGNIGVERVRAATYLWTETDSNPSSGYGRAIARFRYVPGVTLSYGKSDLVVHRPVPGSTSNQPYVDQRSRRLIVRHRVSGASKFAIYDLDAAIAGDFDPLHYIDQYVGEAGESFQGFCLHGDRVYLSTGKHYTDEGGSNPPSGGGDAYLSEVSASTGELLSRSKNLVAPELVYREPEGLSIRHAGPPRLVMGLASGLEGERKISLFQKRV